jgi:catechol 2,3-dioxygenase-like lactoylglutathione lyase family enzyme
LSIIGIEAVTFGVKNIAKSKKFLTDWGLKVQKTGAYGTDYACVDGSEVKIRAINSRSLPSPIQAGSTVREVTWGVEKKKDLKNLAQELSRDRKLKIFKDGSFSTWDDIGLGIKFCVSKLRNLKPKPLQYNVPGSNVRVDKPATYYDRATPQTLSHIVLGVPDFKIVESFYGERLGFRATDRYTRRGVFLRAGKYGNHHNLFVMNIDARKPKFNHLAFKVRDIHEVIGGGQFLTNRGWRSQVGPGRHYISSACFWYFESPLGGALEYCADEDIVTDKWQTREFEVGPDLFSEWTFNAGSTFKAPTAASRAK